MIYLFLSACLALAAPAPTPVGSGAKLYARGLELLQKKDTDGALLKFADAIKQQPSFIPSYIDYARTAVLLKKRKDGLDKLELGLKQATKKDDRQRLMEERANLTEIFFTNQCFQQYQNGVNNLHMERWSAAVSDLEHALQAEPDNVAILAAYGEALGKDNNSTASIKAYEQALLLNPDKKEARLGLAEALDDKQSKRILALVEPLALQSDGPERAALVYAKALVSLGKPKDANEFLRLRAERNSDWVESLFWLGKNYSQNKEGSWMARKYLMMFLKREREHPMTAAMREEAQTLLARVNDQLQ